MTIMLKSNEYKWMYRSFDCDFEKDFFYPSYAESVRLDRASGYFSLNSLLLSFDGLMKFIQNDGCIRIICNPDLSSKDIALIDAGTSVDPCMITEDLIRQLEEEQDEMVDKVCELDVICNMIAEGRLTIRIAFKKCGIYHEKFGIFYDEEGSKLYFNGSANETHAAKVENFESFQVTPSWRDDCSLVITNEEELYFNRIWEDEIPMLKVIEFPQAVKDRLFAQYKRSATLQNAINNYQLGKVPSAKSKELYPYQEKAIEEFLSNHGMHFYEMATGTGKTFTSVRTIRALKKKVESPLFVLICVPQIDLQVQWKRALEEDGFDDVTLFGGINTSGTDQSISHAMISSAMGDEDVICVSTYDTFFGKVAQRCRNINNFFLIIDEAHNLTPNQIKSLPKSVKYKLGLSATIQRFSESETKAIVSYFTNDALTPYYYGIEDAIQAGFLSHYEYHPIFVQLTTDEFASYQKKTHAIATEMNKDDWERDDELLNKLRTERSLIVKKATNKLEKLIKMTQDDYEFRNSVVYCGQGKDGDEPIIDSVTKILYDAGLSLNTFTSKTDNRPRVLEEFEKGYYDTLVAIKCFDEGVDVPKLDKIYIMASDSQLRQTVQRRGRVLRVCKETGKTIAFIYDMVVLPPTGYYSEMGVKSLVVNEFRRAREYTRLSENKESTYQTLDKYMDTYEIIEEDFCNEHD